MFPPPHPHAQLQAIESIEPSDPLAIHAPAFAPQQHPDPLIPKPRSRMGEIPNAHPQAPIDPWPDSADTRRPDQTGPDDRPAAQLT